ncbi:sensor histidine kinase [Gayadomonas joobiniege]|uniref:sensor histidine kinase n=1 Tax=Gayadomonas joobiniege TaxID=1234606 RepID=UPI0003770166|nr:histidine kinase [Gayadomonas joobiniege]
MFVYQKGLMAHRLNPFCVIPIFNLAKVNDRVTAKNRQLNLFWLCQTSGWLVYALLTEVMIKLPSAEPWHIHIPHLFLDTCAGFLMTLFLREIFKTIEHFPTALSIPIHIFCIVIACLLWTQFKWSSLTWLYQDPNAKMTWFDFGTWNLASLTMLSTWSGFYYAIKAYLKGVEQQKKAAEAINLAKESQLKMLRYQLNPHFMFNSINAICTLILQKNNLHAVDMLEKLCDLLRYSLYTDPLAKVTVDEEIQVLNNYCEIEKCRFKDKLKVTIKATPETQKCLVPSLLLQPLVENSIKHGIQLDQKQYAINVDFTILNEQLVIQVSDNGCGFKENLTTSDFGIGLKNSEDRLNIIYPKQYQLSLNNGPHGGALLIIKIPVQTNTG